MNDEIYESTSVEEGYIAQSGTPTSEPCPSTNSVVETLKSIHDPEIPVNIYDLGLIYDMQINNGSINIVMTLTTPACPVAQDMPHLVANRLANIPGSGIVTVKITWTPPWTPDLMSDEARMALDIF